IILEGRGALGGFVSPASAGGGGQQSNLRLKFGYKRALTCPVQRPAALYNSMIWTEMRAVRIFLARNPLAVAFTLSLSVHLTLFGGWKLGKRMGWWQHQATWLLDWGKKKHRSKPLQPMEMVNARTPQREIPLTFVEVDPST